ncbi:hypothetical protein E3E12_02170 [Formicincola oecophyllae]|uniref:Uncharacterized protein n=1 Tax=Formicincola oecophyllae TaxID=2558361 RepID=A0A4Y6U742_9PROT|nr:hypothetical protein [Formicincola oecophyllae]QDH13199.1 hypothetical protein E3E12_02170 [Formicincola oecophyllae]
MSSHHNHNIKDKSAEVGPEALVQLERIADATEETAVNSNRVVGFARGIACMVGIMLTMSLLCCLKRCCKKRCKKGSCDK